MKLVYEKTGIAVQVGDKATTFRGEAVVVTGMREPHKQGSTGRVYVKPVGGEASSDSEYYPGVIGAKWVED